MSKWTTPKEIKSILEKKWNRGHVLRALFYDDGMFPLRIKLKSPKTAEINPYFTKIREWNNELCANSKGKLGYGYEIVYKEIQHSVSGRNAIPTHVVFATFEDVVQTIKKEKEVQKYLRNAKKLLNERAALREWVMKYPFRVIGIGNECDKVLQVLAWFEKNPNSGLYLRQVDIHGVDTKFIEKRIGLIKELLNIILPTEAINQCGTSFQERFGLNSEPKMIRFRILDDNWKIEGFEDLTVPVDQLGDFNAPVTRVFITENKTNFLCFPKVKDACVIFGGGYGVDICKEVPWLQNKDIYYWGDIDTHGLNILSNLRSFLPKVRSFLMTEEILLSHKEEWVSEEKPFTTTPKHLTNDEYELYCKLSANHYDENIRLEQERIAFSYVEEFLKAL